MKKDFHSKKFASSDIYLICNGRRMEPVSCSDHFKALKLVKIIILNDLGTGNLQCRNKMLFVLSVCPACVNL